MHKKDYELIATAIAEEARPKLAVYKMLKAVDKRDTVHRAKDIVRVGKELQTLWNLTLKLRDKLQYTSQGFDATKFCDMATTSPQNWRYMDWVNGEYINVYDSQKEIFS